MTLCLVFLLILFYFWRFDHFGKAPYKKLFVCMYVCKQHLHAFTNHINSITPEIQFTAKKESEGKLHMLDVLVHHKQDGTLKTTAYRKPTHTDQYLDMSSHNLLQHKLG